MTRKLKEPQDLLAVFEAVGWVGGGRLNALSSKNLWITNIWITHWNNDTLLFQAELWKMACSPWLPGCCFSIEVEVRLV